MARDGKTLLFFCILSSLFPFKGFCDSVSSNLEKAQNLVFQKKYSLAIRKVKPLLDGLKLNTVETIVLAHKILGVSYCETHQKKKAEEHFEILFTFSPNETWGEFSLSQPCKDIFLHLQKKELLLVQNSSGETFSLSSKPSPEEIKPFNPPAVEKDFGPTTHPPLSSTPPTPLAPPTVSSSSEPSKPAFNSPPLVDLSPSNQTQSNLSWLHFLPFGAGQFANQEPKKGGTLLLTQVLTLGAAITSFLLFRSEEKDGTFAHPTQASFYRGMYWGSLGLGGTIALLGIGDALNTQRQKQHPPLHLLSFRTFPSFESFSKGCDP